MPEAFGFAEDKDFRFWISLFKEKSVTKISGAMRKRRIFLVEGIMRIGFKN